VTRAVHLQNSSLEQLSGARAERRAHGSEELCASEEQFRAAQSSLEVIEATRRPGSRSASILQTLVDGYSERPAVGQRAGELATPARLLAALETISYRELWDLWERVSPLRGAPTPTQAFRAAVRAAKIGADNDIPHLPASLINKYATDLGHLGLLFADAPQARSTPTGRAGYEMTTENR
jgi:hypothetical protein